jgi:hypothetical protein
MLQVYYAKVGNTKVYFKPSLTKKIKKLIFYLLKKFKIRIDIYLHLVIFFEIYLNTYFEHMIFQYDSYKIKKHVHINY